MKAVRIHAFGGAERLRLEEVDRPQPGADEVLIKNQAAGVNYADIMLRAGTYLENPQLPAIPGFEAAGMIEAVGANVTGWQPGRRVLALVRKGGYAEYVAAPASHLMPIPEDMTFGQASALLVQGMTAVALLRNVHAGQTLLIQAAAGGVGSLLVQLAKHKGARIIATASSAEKLTRAIELGGGVGINYTESDWTEQVLRATGGKGADVILEMAGGDIGRHALSCLAPFGTMIVYGSASRQDFQISALGLLPGMHTVKGYYLTMDNPRNRTKYAKELLEHIKAGRLLVTVTEFPLARAADAHRIIEDRKTMGKVVLTIG